MSSRRAKPPKKAGCKPDSDVCVEHDMPLVCRHACTDGARASKHECGDTLRSALEPDQRSAPPNGATRSAKR